MKKAAKDFDLESRNFEKILLHIKTFPILNIQKALTVLNNNESLLKDLLSIMANQELPQAIQAFKKAYKQNNWDEIEYLAHKMKGGAIYVGAERMKMACQYFERYLKAGHSTFLQLLYQHILDIMDETCHDILCRS